MPLTGPQILRHPWHQVLLDRGSAIAIDAILPSPLCPPPHSVPSSALELQSLAAPGGVLKTASLSGHLPSNGMGACDSIAICLRVLIQQVTRVSPHTLP